MINKQILSVAAILFLIVGIRCEAQVRPFLYTTSSSVQVPGRVNLHIDAGWGDGSLGFSNASAVDLRIGSEWGINSRWTLLGNVAVGKDDSSHTVLSGQFEGLYALRNNSQARFRATAGGGIRVERDKGTVALLKFLGGWQTPFWRFDGNMVLEKASDPDRDPIDVIVSMGWSHRVTSFMHVGIEALGQDLEGFWEPNEAEGGARILLGPSIHFEAEPWEAGIAGGYIFRPTFSELTSPADRPLGSDRLAIQVSFGRVF